MKDGTKLRKDEYDTLEKGDKVEFYYSPNHCDVIGYVERVTLKHIKVGPERFSPIVKRLKIFR